MTIPTIVDLTTKHIRPALTEDVHLKFAQFSKDVQGGKGKRAAPALLVIISKVEEIARLSGSRIEQVQCIVKHGREVDKRNRSLAEHEEKITEEKEKLIVPAEARVAAAKSQFEEANKKMVVKEGLMDTEEKAVASAKAAAEIPKIAHHRARVHEMYSGLLELQKAAALRQKTFVEAEAHLAKCVKEHAECEAQTKKLNQIWLKMKEFQSKFESLASLWRGVKKNSEDFVDAAGTFEGELEPSDGKGFEAETFKASYTKIHGDWHTLAKMLEEAGKVQDNFKFRCGCCQKEHPGFPAAASETLLCEVCKDPKHKK